MIAWSVLVATTLAGGATVGAPGAPAASGAGASGVRPSAAPGTDAPAALAAAAQAALVAPDARTVADGLVPDEALLALSVEAGWRVRARAGAALLWRREADYAAAVEAALPGVTRSGALRFVDRSVREPDAAPLLIERLLLGGEDRRTRAAIVEALRLTKGDWSEAAASLAAGEADPEVRAQLAAALADADAASARTGLSAAFGDPAPAVRAAACRAAAARPDAAQYGESLVAALADTDPATRADAARGVGWLAIPRAWDSLVPLLADRDPEVRLHALNALERLDPARARTLPGVAPLRRDPDPRVARAAQRIAG